jgi:hypothetical protein
MLNVKDFGAKGDDSTDDRAAIQAAIDAAVTQGSGGIRIPSGVYRVSQAPDGRWSLDLAGVANFTVAGDGPASVVKLVDTSAPTGDWHVVILRDGAHDVLISDLVLDGNRTGLSHPDEQSHGLEIEPGTEDVTIDRCVFRECHGDGLRLLGHEDAHVRRVRVSNSLVARNKRSGLAVQRAVADVIVEGCMFQDTITDQSIDFEPTGVDAPTDLLIHGCVIVHTNPAAAITLSGISGPDPAVRVTLADCLLIGGSVFSTDVSRLVIHGNTITVPQSAKQRPAIQIQRGGDGVLVTDNLLVCESAQAQAVVSISEVNRRQVTRARIADNICLAAGGIGIECISSDDAAIAGNLVVATGACAAGISVRSQPSPTDGIAVRDNDVVVTDEGSWDAGVLVASRATQPVGQLTITGNAVRGAQAGVQFTGEGFGETPVCGLNRVEAATSLAGLQALPENAVITGGATTGPGRTLVGLGDPNGTVLGSIGDTYQRIDGGPGHSFYVKEAGAVSPSGWAAK